MPKSRNRKQQKSKSKARTTKISDNKKRFEKLQRNFIMDMIEKEKANGSFDNLENFPSTIIDDTKSNDSPAIEGPQI